MRAAGTGSEGKHINCGRWIELAKAGGQRTKEANRFSTKAVGVEITRETRVLRSKIVVVWATGDLNGDFSTSKRRKLCRTTIQEKIHDSCAGISGQRH